MRDGLYFAVLELYTEMGCLLREAQLHLSPEAFQRMISETGITTSQATGSMRLAREIDGLIIH
jgi:hypothetical protein